MLKASFLVCFIFSSFFLFSQISFQGKITYKLTAENKDRSARIEVFYGKQKIKGIIKNSGLEFKNPDILLIDFTKGLIYEIADSTKSYSVDSIRSKPVNSLFSQYQESGKKKDILRQPCTAYSYIDTATNGLGGAMNLLFWYADSLHFPVSEKFLNSDDIAMFTNGKKIGMGMTMKMDLFGNKTFLNLEAIQIEEMLCPDSLFNLPAGYTLKEKDSLQLIDLLQPDNNYTIELSEIKAESPPPPPPPPPPAPPKKKLKHKL